ncbi:MAG TPA: 1-acyl-sn-glycerol-3-phosphate acyltransferase, partial [Solirubrobacter sp.]|nr:1-acyl-sn-glycerol-3-phosphate acyltransferase [Solirubrobacter sp.]
GRTWRSAGCDGPGGGVPAPEAPLMRSPPVRRVVVAPLVLGAELALIAAAPVLAALAAVLSPLFGGRRPLRALAFALAYATSHVAAVGACAALWAAGFEGRRAPHYAVLRWFVGAIARTALRVARVGVTIHGSERAEAALGAGDRPVVVLSIHSGEGDSLLVLDHLLRRHRRRPRIVMHEALGLDPLIDVIGRRLPNRFVDPRGGDIEAEIAAMSRGMGGRDAVLIFPEGGNFSAERRRRAIDRLLHRGHVEEAESARAMRHLLAPRPGGALAALDGAPDADVVFFAHHGFPAGMRDTWRALPGPTRIAIELWLVPAGDVPRGQDERIDWLFGWWRTLDAWVATRHAER